VTVLVGFTRAGVIVVQYAQTLGASSAELGSWLWALGWGMGLTSIGLSLRYKVPIITAWSTPGAALLITSAAGVSMAEAIGAFLICGGLLTLFGVTGWFERGMKHLPLSLASGMLAGVLLQFGMRIFTAMQVQLWMVGAMFLSYLLIRQLLPRYAIIASLGIGLLIASIQGNLAMETVQLQWARPIFTSPQFSINALVGVALPLFLVTMASQNVPGVVTIRAFGYSVPTSPLVAWTGAATFLLAPFGAFAINLAAITAAISMGRESHENPDRRYIAGIAVGIFYILVGLLGGTVSTIFAALPTELVVAIAGLALLGTIGKSLHVALSQEKERDAALITFLVTASGTTLAGIGSAFWGLIAGLLTLLIIRQMPSPWRIQK
ncbi:MAG: benzoate/H(+) symporter BenE family transporter, partial [Moorea sp. SIO3C2]|nr:benzoate/H(+) symporter BenE family transporter [Moorena sp. SIO3C2]